MNTDFHLSPDVARLNPSFTPPKTVPASKYHNTPTEYAGMKFASKYEAAVVSQLMIEEKEKVIFGLRLQVNFPLPGGVIYRADAVFSQIIDGKLQTVVMDAKGHRTREYINKAKQFKAIYGLEILEIREV